ncbi:MAG: undecaprenyl-diphosphate phosphatase [Rhodothermales bacterium]
MNWWEAAILGLIQGLTEFLPISSSGHLVLGEYLLGLTNQDAQGVTFEVFVHFGTALSIITVYRSRILELIAGTARALAKPAQFAASYRENDSFRTALFILLTMIPTGLTYIMLKDFLEARFDDPRFTCSMLIVTGILLMLTVLRKNPSGPITPLKALIIGIAQSAAMIPGISRSGSTICAALYQNVTPQRAADFSFLMLLPVVLGATLIQGLEVMDTGIGIGWDSLLLGTVVAYVSGIVAIKVVIDFVRRGNLQYFAYYCFLVGALGLWLIR